MENKYRIVLVDDDELYLDLISNFSKLLDIDCQVFPKWDDNISQHLNEHCLLILDLQMPEIDGLDIIHKLAERAYGGPICLMSGLDTSILESANSLAMKNALNILPPLKKPFPFEQFKHVIDALNTGVQVKRPVKEVVNDDKLGIEELRMAMDKGWFYPSYQPQINLVTRQVEGVECLARLKFDERGNISPVRFIKWLEEQDLISEFTLHIVKRALREMAIIYGKGYQLGISFNISALSLNLNFYEKLLALFINSEIPLHFITLEITESSAISIKQEALFILSKFRVKGLNLAIDDFGTGYSTIKQLDELPFNEIKLDKSFVENVHSKDSTRAIVAATSLLAKNLNYRFVGEGVETLEQIEFLRVHQCRIAQGFIFSKPLTLMELSAYLYNLQDGDVMLLDTHRIPTTCVSPEQTIIILHDDNESTLNFIDAFDYFMDSKIEHASMAKPLPDLDAFRQIIVCGHYEDSFLASLAIDPTKQQLFIIREIANQEHLEAGLDHGVSDVFEWSILPHELLQRLNQAYKYSEKISTTEQQLQSVNQAAMSAMQEASQYGTLLQFVKNTLRVKNKDDLISGTITYLNSQGYSVAVQLRDGISKFTKLNDRTDSPLMIERIFETLHQHDKLYQFGDRFICSTKDVSILFLALPEDSFKLGQLKDIAATIVDVMEEKWIEVREHKLLEDIAHKLVNVSGAITRAVELVREESDSVLSRISEEIYQSFHVIDLNEEQEKYLLDLIKNKLDSKAVEHQLETLSALVGELENLANSAVNEEEPISGHQKKETPSIDDDVILF